jgi:hypothetical protein
VKPAGFQKQPIIPWGEGVAARYGPWSILTDLQPNISKPCHRLGGGRKSGGLQQRPIISGCSTEVRALEHPTWT